MLTSWTHPATKNDQRKVTLKLEVSWSSENDKLANYNPKAVHAIFNGVDAYQIRLIASYESAKEAGILFKKLMKELVI